MILPSGDLVFTCFSFHSWGPEGSIEAADLPSEEEMDAAAYTDGEIIFLDG